MKLFISWSGNASRTVAKTFRDWIPLVINDVQPWMSEEDIAAGSHWPTEIHGRLRDAKFGVICITPENTSRPWLLFEAGALAKAIDESKIRVCPYLFGLAKSDLTPPLAHFQSETTDKIDTFKLLQSINETVRSVDGLARTDPQLESAFEKWWPDLERALGEIRLPLGAQPEKRDQQELLAEILETVRSIARSQSMEASTREIASLSANLDNPDVLTAWLKKEAIDEVKRRTAQTRRIFSPNMDVFVKGQRDEDQDKK